MVLLLLVPKKSVVAAAAAVAYVENSMIDFQIESFVVDVVLCVEGENGEIQHLLD